MSTLTWFGQFEPYLETICPDYYSSWLKAVWIALIAYPVFMTAAMWALSLYHKEIYFFFAGIVLGIDWWINIGLKQIFKQLSPFITCSVAYEMPSFTTQHAMLSVMMIIALPVLYGYEGSLWSFFIMYLLMGSVIYSAVITGVNSPQQLMAGSAVGFIEGILWMLCFWYFIQPSIPHMMNWWFFRQMKMDNTICLAYHDRVEAEEGWEKRRLKQLKRLQKKEGMDFVRNNPDYVHHVVQNPTYFENIEKQIWATDEELPAVDLLNLNEKNSTGQQKPRTEL